MTDVTDRNPRITEAWDERAAIMEFDGGLSREEAERQALNDPFVKDLLDVFPDATLEVVGVERPATHSTKPAA